MLYQGINHCVCLVTQLCLALCDPMDCSLPGLLCPWNFPGKSTRVGCHFLLQGIFPTQGSNPGLPHCSLLIWTGGSTPLLCLEGVPDLPVAPQDEAGLTKTFQTWPRGWFHIP